MATLLFVLKCLIGWCCFGFAPIVIAGWLANHGYIIMRATDIAFADEDIKAGGRRIVLRCLTPLSVLILLGCVTVFVITDNLGRAWMSIVYWMLFTLVHIWPNRRLSFLRVGAALVLLYILMAVVGTYQNWLVIDVVLALFIMSFCFSFYETRIRSVVLLSLFIALIVAIRIFGNFFLDDEDSSALLIYGFIQIPSGFALDSEPCMYIAWTSVAASALWVMPAFRMAKQYGQKRVIVTTLIGLTFGWLIVFYLKATRGFGYSALFILLPCAALGYFITALPRRYKDPSKTVAPRST